MRVAFIVTTFPCISETFILNQITGLIDRGVEVDIFAEKPSNDNIIHEDVERYKLLDRTHYFCNGSSGQSMPVNRLKRLIKVPLLIIQNINKNPAALLNSINAFKYGIHALSLRLLYKTAVMLTVDKYDIIHCHFGANGNIGAYLKEIGVTSAKIITTFHGYDITKHIKENGNNAYALLFSKGDLFMPISERWKNKLKMLGCQENKIIVHRMGVDLKKFIYSPRQINKNGKVTVLTVARLVEKKGVEYGIRAVALVLEKYPGIEFRIAGDGPLMNYFKLLIAELNVHDSIKLLGCKPQEEIVGLMKRSDILLAPSVTGADGDQEGIPVVLMEALAQGMPVISTYHSGIPELVQDGKSGFLVPEKDVNALADKLIYLIEHPDVWPQMGQVGRNYIEENYMVDKLNDRLIEIYRQVSGREN